MQVTIDRAGRLVVPKPMREQLGITQDTRLEIEVVNGHLELSVPYERARVLDGPNGPVVAATGAPITDEDVRRTLEAVRERG
jgi:AbrB family looped-hinge helix DNA binding protein